MKAFAYLLLAAQAAPDTNQENTLSHIQVQDRGIVCEKAPGAVGSHGPRMAAPCDVEDWEVRVVGTYPEQALRDEVSGTIRIYGIVTPEGRLTDCARTTLGNPWPLGYNICPKIEEHARFQVGLSESGEPVTQPVSLLITFVLPDWPKNSESYQRQAKPRDVERWLRRIQENFPSTPIRRDLSGTVGVKVLVDRNGRVARCLVTQSTNKPITDEAACRGMVRYARFEPAINARGKAVLGVFQTEITYRFY